MIGVGGDADEDTHVRASCLGNARSQAISRGSGVLDGRPNRFEEQALLGIDDLGFRGGNLEEMWVELVVVVQETAPLTVDLPLRSGGRIRMIELIDPQERLFLESV